MMKQENNIEYFPVLNMGFHRTFIENLPVEDLLKKVYKFKEGDFNNSVKKSNRGGYQSTPDIHTHSDFYDLTHNLNTMFFKIFRNPLQTISSMWVNISYYEHSNYIHTHGNDQYTMSGVLYLQIPENSGEIGFINPISHCIDHLILPRAKELFIFPQNLPHLVNPNLSQKERISIAFNYEE